MITANNYAFIDYLWASWSLGHEDRHHIDRITRMLAAPGALAATLGYYRAMSDPKRADPALHQVREAFGRPIHVPTLAIGGGDDQRSIMREPQKGFFHRPS